MRRRPITFTEHDAAASAPVAVSWGPAGPSRIPPQSAGPTLFNGDPFVVVPSDEDLARLIRQANAEDRIARILPWVDGVAYALCGVALYLAAQPIWVAVRALFP